MKDDKIEKAEIERHEIEHHLGEHLFDRPHPKGYIEEWLQTMEEARSRPRPHGLSVMIFRLNSEWLALPTLSIDRITPIQFIHKLPFKSNSVVLGITNIEGDLRITLSLKSLLGLGNNINLDDKRLYTLHQRAIVINKDAQYFVFPVDEILGTAFFVESESENIPLTVSKSAEHFTQHLFQYDDKHVGLLDPNLIINNVKEHYL